MFIKQLFDTFILRENQFHMERKLIQDPQKKMKYLKDKLKVKLYIHSMLQ